MTSSPSSSFALNEHAKRVCNVGHDVVLYLVVFFEMYWKVQHAVSHFWVVKRLGTLKLALDF